MWTVCVLLALRIALGQQSPWEQHMKEADRLEKVNRYQEAKAAYQAALQDLQDDDGRSTDSGLRKATTWNNLAVLNGYLGNYAEARQQHQKALDLLRDQFGVRSWQYASALHNLAVLEYDHEELDEAARQFRR